MRPGGVHGPPDAVSTAVDVLRAGGEVGRDLLAVDWAATPLGPPEGWPQSLTTVVNVLLGSRFAMWMAWGPELTFFCNDAYRRDTLAAKYPWALGRPASEVWSEIWPDIGPRIDQVTSTGEATWDEALRLFLERSGYREETYHTFSYSPLAGDDGRIAGMLCVVSEETERVIAERRLAMLRGLSADVALAGSEPEVLDAVARCLDAGRESLPFSLLYLLDDEGVARRQTAVGLAGDHPAAPEAIVPGDPAALWPVPATGDADGVVVGDLRRRVGDLPTGTWIDPPTHAIVAPIAQQGRPEPYGVLVAGVNPHRPLDAGYREFVALVAGQMAAGIASARAYDAERERAEQLAALDRAKTTFFTNVSHELRTPLTLLLGPAEDALADREHALAPEQRRRVEVVERNARRLLKLVNTLLDFSRLEAGRSDARYEPVDLAAYTAELASMFRSAVDRAGIELVVDCPPLDEPVHIDREMWAKVVLNLLSNALKFTLEGGVEVRVGRDADGRRAHLVVADTGIGIPEGEQARLFDRFHRVGGAEGRTHEGSGIGLALVAELAQLHGGTVDVESEPGRGTTFIVRVPFGVRHLDPERIVAAPDGEIVPEAARRQAEGFVAEAVRWGAEEDRDPAPAATDADDLPDRPRVLVVDDNDDMRRYVAELLDGEFAVRTARDGGAALDLVRRESVDLVLTDVTMPVLDGFELLAALRADPETLHVPVVMLSARAGEEGTIEGLEAGADDYLIKPFDARELLARVRANLELDRARRARDELARSRELLDQAQRLAKVGSWEIDAATQRVRASAEFLRILQLPAEVFEAMTLEEAISELVHAEDRSHVVASLEAGLTGAPITFEARIVRPDGTEVLVRAHGEVVRSDDGRPQRMRGSVQDITDQRAAEQALAQAAAEREAAAREHEIAAALQRSLLPPTGFAPAGLEVSTFYRPGVEGTEVGGDWFDVINLGGDRTALVIGDVMGRGVRAAAVMGQLRAAVRAYARLDLAPAAVLRSLDGLVSELDIDQIVTCVYAVFDGRDRTLVYANAGHLPPLVVEPGATAAQVLDVGGPPLGSELPDLEEARIALPAGAVVALYTDGLVERRDREIGLGVELLGRELAAQAAAGAPAPERLVGALMPDGADDDIAVLVARLPAGEAPLPLPSPTLRLRVPAEPDALAAVRADVGRFLDEQGVTTPLRYDVSLAISEAATNALVHAFRGRDTPGTLTVELTAGAEALSVVVADDGAGLAPRSDSPGAGLGLPVMAELADDLDVGRSDSGGTAVRMSFRR